MQSLDPDQGKNMSGLIWIQTAFHSDGIPKISILKISADNKKPVKFVNMHCIMIICHPIVWYNINVLKLTNERKLNALLKEPKYCFNLIQRGEKFSK